MFAMSSQAQAQAQKQALLQAETRRLTSLVEVGEAVVDFLRGGPTPQAQDMFHFVDFLQNEAEAFHRRAEVLSLVSRSPSAEGQSRSWIASWRRGEHQRAREILIAVRRDFQHLPARTPELAVNLERYLLLLRSLLVFETQVLPQETVEKQAA